MLQTSILQGLTLTVECIEGRNLVAKDRSKFGLGKKNSSDPYAVLYVDGKKCGKTSVIKKTLSPVWNEKLVYKISKADEVTNFVKHPPPVRLHLFDHDNMSDDDPMGTVEIELSFNAEPIKNWMKVEQGSGKFHCRNATGEIHLCVNVTAEKLMRLVPGNVHKLNYSNVTVGLAWESERGVNIDLDASCVALSSQGKVLMNHTVYYGNICNPNRSIVHGGDETTGDTKGDDETIDLHLDKVPNEVVALFLILSVVTPKLTIDQIKSTKVRFYHPQGKHNLRAFCGLSPSELQGGEMTSIIVARINRKPTNSGHWYLCPIEAGTEPARDFGSLIPHVKSFAKDLIPSISCDATEKIAIMRKNGVIRVRDFCSGNRVPSTVSFGLAWDITDGCEIDLDASAICLDANLEAVEVIFFNNLKSENNSIRHTGDERSGEKSGDDETINMELENIPAQVVYIGIVVNSYSGQELDDVARASCRLYDTETRTEIARYALSDSKPLDKHTALVMGCLYRSGMEWLLTIISEPAQGKTAFENVDELQNFLRRNPPPRQPTVVVENEGEINPSMPSFKEHKQEEEITVVPISSVTPEIVAPPPAPPASTSGAPKKFIKVGGIMKVNPEFKAWKEAQG